MLAQPRSDRAQLLVFVLRLVRQTQGACRRRDHSQRWQRLQAQA